MPLDQKAKDFLLKECQITQKNINGNSFVSLMNFGEKMDLIADLYPDETWSKELVTNAIILQTLAATSDHHFKHFSEEKKSKTKELFNEGIAEIIDGLSTESVEKTHNAVATLAFQLHLIFTGEI